MTVVMRFRLVYALLYGGVGIFYTYLALYLKDAGLSGTELGIVLAVLPLAGFLTQPFWGLLVDGLQIHRPALSAACFALALITPLYTFSNSFVWLLGCTVVLAIIRSPVGPLSDALALEYLESQGRRQNFGGLRMWGSLGYAFAAFATGVFVVGHALGLIIYLYSLIMLIMGFVTLTLPGAYKRPHVQLENSGRALLTNPVLIKLMIGALLVGTTLGVVNSYQIVYLDDIHAPGWVSGVAFAIAGVMEAVLMGAAARLIQRWGLRAVFLSGLALLPLRWLLYTVIKNPLLVLPTQVLHSAGMLSLLVAGVLFVDMQLSSRWRATGQTLYAAALQGIGSSIGLVGAGVIYDRAGISAVWLACAIAGTLGLVAMIWATSPTVAKQIEVKEA